MDTETRTISKDKLDHVIPMIGYPDELFDDKKVNEYYKDLDITSESLLNTTLVLNLFTIENEIKNLKKPVTKADWTGTRHS